MKESKNIQRCIRSLRKIQRDGRVGKAQKAELARAVEELKKLATNPREPFLLKEELWLIVAAVCKILLKIVHL